MRSAVLACLLAVAPAPLSAQKAVVALVVLDDGTDAPIPDVRITIAGADRIGVTDARGRFVYAAPRPGTVALLLRRLGYAPGVLEMSIPAGDTTRVTFVMTAVPQTLASVDVRDTLSSAMPALRGFEQRALNRAGGAAYITRADIEMRRPAQVTDLLRRYPSITVLDSAGVLMVVSQRSRKPVVKGGTLDLAPCPLQIAVDGEPKEWGFAVNALAPEQVHGIEIYPGPSTIPAEFASLRPDASCGLVVIWTRRDR